MAILRETHTVESLENLAGHNMRINALVPLGPLSPGMAGLASAVPVRVVAHDHTTAAVAEEDNMRKAHLGAITTPGGGSVTTTSELLASADERGLALVRELAARGLIRSCVQSTGRVWPGRAIGRHTVDMAGVYSHGYLSPADRGLLLTTACALSLLLDEGSANGEAEVRVVGNDTIDAVTPDELEKLAEAVAAPRVGHTAVSDLVIVRCVGIGDLGAPDAYSLPVS